MTKIVWYKRKRLYFLLFVAAVLVWKVSYDLSCADKKERFVNDLEDAVITVA